MKTQAATRYTIENMAGDYFDVYNKRSNAIKAAIKMATEYSGTTFVVVKKTNIDKKIIFQCKIDLQMKFCDVKNVYGGLVNVFQSKLDKTKYWRKSDK